MHKRELPFRSFSAVIYNNKVPSCILSMEETNAPNGGNLRSAVDFLAPTRQSSIFTYDDVDNDGDEHLPLSPRVFTYALFACTCQGPPLSISNACTKSLRLASTPSSFFRSSISFRPPLCIRPLYCFVSAALLIVGLSIDHYGRMGSGMGQSTGLRA